MKKNEEKTNVDFQWYRIVHIYRNKSAHSALHLIDSLASKFCVCVCASNRMIKTK